MRFVFEDLDDPEMMSGGGQATFLRCDTCGQRIDRSEPAIVVFEANGRDRTGQVLVVHKDRCDTAATKPLQWQDLNIFLRDVIRNSGIDLDATERGISGPGGLADWGLHQVTP